MPYHTYLGADIPWKLIQVLFHTIDLTFFSHSTPCLLQTEYQTRSLYSALILTCLRKISARCPNANGIRLVRYMFAEEYMDSKRQAVTIVRQFALLHATGRYRCRLLTNMQSLVSTVR